jgi:hypothetical protein
VAPAGQLPQKKSLAELAALQGLLSKLSPLLEQRYRTSNNDDADAVKTRDIYAQECRRSKLSVNTTHT